ncbi:hypothetical protein [Enterococcus casseliflavus]|uniref:hypothetical protein n=1 Tax=Enterococcus casseliflavus TaxID=37734 RepID=UPI001FCAD0F9|nr:hypothetical protein [Enterococcus casseliflavus]
MTERFSVKDRYWQTNVPWMDTLAHQYPLSGKLHPAWDERVLTTQGFQQIETNERVNDLLLNETQKLNLAFSSIYLIKAIKQTSLIKKTCSQSFIREKYHIIPCLGRFVFTEIALVKGFF